jgi:hypothetical protein
MPDYTHIGKHKEVSKESEMLLLWLWMLLESGREEFYASFIELQEATMDRDHESCSGTVNIFE